jgi:putative Mg2+ transporter-C (MgtC) family protein
MSLIDFTVRMSLALLLGLLIGLEREIKQHFGLVRLTGLVSVGAALFGSLNDLYPMDHSDYTRIAAGIVSGVGFLGAGLIFKDEKLGQARNMNTAACIWSAAAIGAMVGSGYIMYATVGTGFIVGTNLLLKPLIHRFIKKGS